MLFIEAKTISLAVVTSRCYENSRLSPGEISSNIYSPIWQQRISFLHASLTGRSLLSDKRRETCNVYFGHEIAVVSRRQ
jgi:hypothetical protein